MWPELDQVCISLIDCDDATSEMLHHVTDTNRFKVHRFADALAFLEQFDRALPGCAVANFNMPDRGGWELVDVIQAEAPGIQIVFFADELDVSTAVELMKAGVSDVLMKPIGETTLRNCISRAIELDLQRKREFASHSVARRHYTMLTPREREVFQLVVSGLPSKGIAQKLDRSQKTVEVHRTSIMKKMAAKSVVDLVRMGIELHVLDLGENSGRQVTSLNGVHHNGVVRVPDGRHFAAANGNN